MRVKGSDVGACARGGMVNTGQLAFLRTFS